jgi:Icc-related predicted phosphoesterase
VKLLLFSDLHSDTSAAKRLARLAADVDLLIGAGDYCNAHRNLPACLEILRGAGKPMVLVAGNNETTDELAAVCEGWPDTHLLHGSSVIIDGVPVFGIGGGIPVTPFGSWSYDFTEDRAAGLLKDCPSGCVLISHSPPKGAADVSSRGVSLGSTAVRAAVERFRPSLVVCGHIHASAGHRADIGPTPVVNAGPGGVVWDLG